MGNPFNSSMGLWVYLAVLRGRMSWAYGAVPLHLGEGGKAQAVRVWQRGPGGPFSDGRRCLRRFLSRNNVWGDADVAEEGGMVLVIVAGLLSVFA